MKKHNQEAAEKTLAVYETSTDYELLHELAKQGYNIPCFLWSDLFTNGDTLFFCLVRCFFNGYGHVEISEVGRCFVDDMAGLEHFKHWCKKLEVRFIVPNIKEQSK
ncbi:MAG: hypothetical protein J6W00_14935 [Lentisphaeria bacterium]|nr:hypothetical protein [Lentisphaeria bacterium]